MNCFGGAVPDGTNTASITGSWQDNSVAVQSASTGIVWNGASYSSAPSVSAITTFGLDKKRFSTSGFKSLYSFQITCPVAIPASAVFYIDFHMGLSPYLDNSGVV
jgi:hypothetical protein